MKKNKLICIGSIGKPRGLKGEFFLNSFCNPPKNIINYTKYIKTNNDIDLKIEYIKENNLKLLSKIKGVGDVDEIKVHTNTMLYISSNNLPEIKQEEIYWHDLEGMAVIDHNNNEVLGTVKELNNFGSNECLIIQPTDDSVDDQQRIIPFIKNTFIDSIDKKNRVIKVNWQSDY